MEHTDDDDGCSTTEIEGPTFISKTEMDDASTSDGCCCQYMDRCCKCCSALTHSTRKRYVDVCGVYDRTAFASFSTLSALVYVWCVWWKSQWMSIVSYGYWPHTKSLHIVSFCIYIYRQKNTHLQTRLNTLLHSLLSSTLALLLTSATTLCIFYFSFMKNIWWPDQLLSFC